MRVLITGAEGFVGQHIFTALTESSFDVCGCYYQGRGAESFIERYRDKLDFLDIKNKDKTEEFIKSACPDAVVHLAAVSFVPEGGKDPYNIIMTNIYGTQNIISGIQSLDKDCHIIFASSGEVYGSPEKGAVITEKSELKPKSLYAITKLTGEYLCLNSDIPAVIFRLFNHTGIGQRTDFVIPSFARQIAEIEARGQSELKVGNLDSYKDFLDIRDVVDAYVKAVKNPAAGVYNICSSRTYRLFDIVQGMIRHSGKDIKITVDPERYRKSKGGDFMAVNEKFSSVYNWHPKIKIDCTYKNLINYFRSKEDIA